MKKLFAALIASALMVPALSTSAFAAGDGYPGTVRTSVKISAPRHVDLGEVFTVKSKLKVASSNPGTCKGKIVVTVKLGERLKQRGAFIKGGTSRSFKFALRTEGQWTIKSTYHPRNGSPCKGSSATRSISVS